MSVFQHPVIIDAWQSMGFLCFGGCICCGNCRRNCNKLLSLLEVSHSSGLIEKECLNLDINYVPGGQSTTPPYLPETIQQSCCCCC